MALAPPEAASRAFHFLAAGRFERHVIDQPAAKLPLRHRTKHHIGGPQRKGLDREQARLLLDQENPLAGWRGAGEALLQCRNIFRYAEVGSDHHVLQRVVLRSAAEQGRGVREIPFDHAPQHFQLADVVCDDVNGGTHVTLPSMSCNAR